MTVTAPETSCASCDCPNFVGPATAGYCGACGHARTSHGANECESCGEYLSQDLNHCTGCGAPITRRWLRPADGRTEQIGSAIGTTLGRTATTAVTTAVAPVYAKVWSERPSIPTWHKVLGFVSWPIAVLTPHGLVVIGASFVTMVMLGRKNPYQWLAWATKAVNFLLLVTVAAGAIVLIVVYGADSSSDY